MTVNAAQPAAPPAQIFLGSGNFARKNASRGALERAIASVPADALPTVKPKDVGYSSNGLKTKIGGMNVTQDRIRQGPSTHRGACVAAPLSRECWLVKGPLGNARRYNGCLR